MDYLQINFFVINMNKYTKKRNKYNWYSHMLNLDHIPGGPDINSFFRNKTQNELHYMLDYYSRRPIKNENIINHLNDLIIPSRSPDTRMTRSRNTRRRSRSRSRSRNRSDTPGTTEHRWKNKEKLWRNPDDQEAPSPPTSPYYIR